MSWWGSQNLDKPRRDKTGKRWNFRIWHDVLEIDNRAVHVARVFFWDDKYELTGVRLFGPGDDTHITALRSFIEKLVASPTLRSKHRRELRFPLERHYSEFGVFPEETSN